jgi:hypothetical protein
MGQGASARREVEMTDWERQHAQDYGTVKISYLSVKGGNIGDYVTHQLKLKDIKAPKIREIAAEVKERAKNRDITIIAHAGHNFNPAESVLSAVDNPDLELAANGIHVDAFRVLGSFDVDVSQKQQYEWWKNVQQLFNNLGLTMESYGAITVEPNQLFNGRGQAHMMFEPTK